MMKGLPFCFHSPDASAARIRNKIKELSEAKVAVIISDSFGKPDRLGAIGVAIGIAGISHIEEKDQQDLFGNKTKTSIALIDEVAGAASILSGEADESLPVVVVRGVKYTIDESAAITNILV